MDVLKGTSPSVMDQLGKLQRPHYDLTGIMISKGNHPQMAFLHVRETGQFTQTNVWMTSPS